MRKRVLLFTLCGSFGLVVLSSYHTGAARNGYDCTGAESAGTGSLANPTGCTNGGCHGTAATATVAVVIELDSAGTPTTHYKGGLTYNVKITGTNGTGTSLPAYGFQLAALKGTVSTATESDAGGFATTGLPASTHISAPGSYTQLTVAEQSTGISLSGTTFTQSFSWTAPAAGTGAISFWGAVNFVNGNGSADRGDKFNTASVNISEWPSSHVSVDEIYNIFSIQAYPNPVNNELQLEVNGRAEGVYSFLVYDINGKKIADLQQVSTGENQLITFNTSGWAPGFYSIEISNNGNSKVIAVVKK